MAHLETTTWREIPLEKGGQLMFILISNLQLPCPACYPGMGRLASMMKIVSSITASWDKSTYSAWGHLLFLVSGEQCVSS